MPPWTWPCSSSGLRAAPKVVDDAVVHDLQHAGVGIDLELADMAAVGEGVGRRRAGELVVQPGLLARRHVLGILRRLGDVEQAHAAVGADDLEGAVAILDVGRRGLHRARRHKLALGDDLVGHADGRGARHRDHAAAAGHAFGHDVGIALHEVDLVGIDAEPRRGDLADRRLLALAVGLVADEDRDRVVVVELGDGGLRRLRRRTSRRRSPCRCRATCPWPVRRRAGRKSPSSRPSPCPCASPLRSCPSHRCRRAPSRTGSGWA